MHKFKKLVRNSKETRSQPVNKLSLLTIAMIPLKGNVTLARKITSSKQKHLIQVSSTVVLARHLTRVNK